MDERKQLKLSNQHWQDDDSRWQQEIYDWQHETQRLVALLYMMEKALPEHSLKLEQHKHRIDRHNQDLSHYYRGLVSLNTLDDSNVSDISQQRKIHDRMEKSHSAMRKEHDKFSQEYQKKMSHFRDLAQRLIDELEAVAD